MDLRPQAPYHARAFLNFVLSWLYALWNTAATPSLRRHVVGTRVAAEPCIRAISLAYRDRASPPSSPPAVQHPYSKHSPRRHRHRLTHAFPNSEPSRVVYLIYDGVPMGPGTLVQEVNERSLRTFCKLRGALRYTVVLSSRNIGSAPRSERIWVHPILGLENIKRKQNARA